MKKSILTLLAVSGLILASCGGNGDPDPKKEDSTAPAVPSGIQLHSATETSLSFQWSAVSGASQYDWKLLSGGAEVQSDKTSNRNVIISGLTKATDYQFSVRSVAFSSSGTKLLSNWSSAIDARTEGSAEPDPGPSNQYYDRFKIPSVEEDGVARAFPGAEGGGMYTTGGRGGKVIHVTNTKDSGAGSLREALGTSGARIIVFDVAGTIELQSDLKITRGDVTVAGQTAPGDGICLKNYTVNIQANNVIIRFIRFRLGDEAPWTEAQIKNGDADGEDCIWGRYLDNVILDHCSMSWSVDETASFYGNENFTMQWCLIAESMKECKLHSKGTHGYGGIWGGKNASFHHNLLAHHDSRNARIDHPHIYQDHKNPARRGNVELRNNVIYDWGDNSTYGGEGGWFNIVNNYYKKGPSSKDRQYVVDLYGAYTSTCSACGGKDIDDGYPQIYISGNQYDGNADLNNKIYWHNGTSHAHYNAPLSAALTIAGKDGKAAYSTTHSASGALDAVTQWAGASLKKDAVDTRISGDVKAGTGRIIKDIADVKAAYGSAWPAYGASSEELDKVRDSDEDGMPDWFETEFGLNKSSASDAGAKTLDKNGRYTNVEMYLHYLVRDIVAAQNTSGMYEKL